MDAAFSRYGAVESQEAVKVDSVEERNKSNAFRYVAAALIAIVIAAFAIVTIPQKSLNSSLLNFLMSPKTSSSSSLSWTMVRTGYDPLFYFDPSAKSDYLKYKFLDDYDGVIEPYASNDLYVFSDDSDATTYKYTICSTSDTSDCTSGKLSSSKTDSVTIDCSAYDTYTITIKSYSSGDSYLSSTTGDLMCMYVRREMRELTTADLSDTMDAMFEMWSTNTTVGQAKYGSNYYDADYMLGYHFYNAAWQDGDHIHEGLGFFPQHIKLTNFFELSMQAVNPAITLPYWDFTIEDAYNISVWDSFVFTEDTFGSMPTPPDDTWGWLYKNSKVDDAKIPDGRWASAKTGVNTEFPDLVFAYGYMRAPWSMNPSTYITRFTSVDKTLPSCKSHYDFAAYTNLSDVLHWSPYSPHASTHGTIGGVYGCDVFDTMTADGYLLNDQAQRNLCKNWLFYLKEFYRLGIITPKSDCEVNAYDSTISSCGFTCDMDMIMLFRTILTGILNSDYVVANVTDASIDVWVDLICNGAGYKSFGGDHLEAASAADPSFWPIHPTMDRIIQARYMAGGYNNYTWPTDGETDYVCDKAECFQPSTKTFVYNESCCQGHWADDKIMISDTTEVIQYVGMTNTEQLDAINPTLDAYAVPYIYSNFNYTHCLNQGVDITGLLDDYHTSYLEGTLF